MVGASEKVPPIFNDIDWNTDQVWQQTLAGLEEHNIDFGVLPVWYDVDEVDDLARLRSEIADTYCEFSQILKKDLDAVFDSGA